MFAIPKPILEGIELHVNAQVGLLVSNGRLIVEPHPRRRYTLDELISQCDLSAPISDETRVWMDDEPVGRERI
jgi:antitoxin ChpS